MLYRYIAQVPCRPVYIYNYNQPGKLCNFDILILIGPSAAYEMPLC